MRHYYYLFFVRTVRTSYVPVHQAIRTTEAPRYPAGYQIFGAVPQNNVVIRKHITVPDIVVTFRSLWSIRTLTSEIFIALQIMGDFSRGFHRPDAGISTVEGTVSGARAMRLEQKRQAEQEEFELQKQKRLKSGGQDHTLGNKFQTARIGRVEEQAFKAKTVGLVTAEEFLSAAKDMEDTARNRLTKEQQAAEEEESKRLKKEKAKKSKRKKKEKKKMASLLSFMDAEEDEEEVETKDTSTSSATATSSLKDPTVDTSFLPDKRRDMQEKADRLRLEQDWKERQIGIQKEKLEITYSYWDGSGHRRTCVVSKGSSIGEFLEVVRRDICGEFKELTTVAADALLYVKEDLILPQDITFYDLIVTKARGKSGPLFHFDVHEDVRLGPLDRRVEKDESHPGKVVERRWYERNKHIFPASRWELYDPAKTYGKYTIHGGEVVIKKGK